MNSTLRFYIHSINYTSVIDNTIREQCFLGHNIKNVSIKVYKFLVAYMDFGEDPKELSFSLQVDNEFENEVENNRIYGPFKGRRLKLNFPFFVYRSGPNGNIKIYTITHRVKVIEEKS